MLLSEHEELVLEMVYEKARRGLDETAKYIAPVLDRLMDQDHGPYAKISPAAMSVEEQLVLIKERDYVRVKQGDRINSEIRMRMESVGQPLPKISEEGVVIGPPPSPPPLSVPPSMSDNRSEIDKLRAQFAQLQKSVQYVSDDLDTLPGVPRRTVAPLVAPLVAPATPTPPTKPPLETPREDYAAPLVVPTPPTQPAQAGEPAAIPIATVDIRAPARQALVNYGITDLRDMTRYPKKEIAKIKGVGEGAMAELHTLMRHEGIRFRREPYNTTGKRRPARRAL